MPKYLFWHFLCQFCGIQKGQSGTTEKSRIIFGENPEVLTRFGEIRDSNSGNSVETLFTNNKVASRHLLI